MTTKILKRNKAFAVYAGFFSCIALASVSCKERNVGNTDAIPQVDNIHTFETITENMEFASLGYDTLFTNDHDFPLGTIGYINDPFFGTTKAGMYFQLAVGTEPFEFPTDGVADSIVVSIPYYTNSNGGTYVYGDSTLTSTFQVHKITEKIDFDVEKLYFAHDRLAYNPTVSGVAAASYQDIISKRVLANGDTIQNELRIKMGNAFVSEMVDFVKGEMILTPEFLEKMPGLYVQPANDGSWNWLGLFLATDNDSRHARFTMYYTSPSDSVQKQAIFRLKLNSGIFFTALERNRTGYPANNYIQKRKTDSLVMQSMPGIKGEVTIQIPENIPPSVIHKAELEITMLNPNTVFSFPNQIIARHVNESGNEEDLLDRFSGSSLEHVGGWPIEVKQGSEKYIKYRFNVARELQDKLKNGEKSITLRLYPTAIYPGFYSGIFGGVNAPDAYKPKFKVVYSIK